MSTILFDLEREPVPQVRYDMIVTVMTMHHVADTDRILRAFHELLRPVGTLCIADLDSEPGLFHSTEALGTVHHHGFDRGQLKQRLERAGFHEVRDVTVHTIRKPVGGGQERDFPVFLMTARRL